MSEKREKGIVLLGKDATIAAKAKNMKLPVLVDDSMPLAFGKTLFVAPGTRVPWDLLGAAWHFLERWDAAVPLWRYGVTAADVGSKEERKRTAEVVRDLRVLLHSVELLFVRDNEDGRALVDAFREEMGFPLTPGDCAVEEMGSPLTPALSPEGEGERRLAFLRALYRVKPRVCVLPRSWLAEVMRRSSQDARARAGLPRSGRASRGDRPAGGRRGLRPASELVKCEVLPGRFVKCRKGDEEQVKARFQKRGRRRHE